MNIVDVIKNQLSGDVMGKLSQLVGASEQQTKTAVGAAVPALLTGLSSAASDPGKASALNSALGGLDLGSLGNLGSLLTGGGGGLLEKGGGLLSSILGGNVLGGLTGALEKFSGLGGGAITKLLSALLPMILGALAGQRGGKLDARGLAGMLADQKQNIAGALPSGFSLGNIPGLSSAGAAVSQAAGTAQQAASGSPAWLLPLALLALIAAGAWWYFSRQPGPQPPVVGLPDVTQVTKELGGWFTSLNDSLGNIKDVATAEANLPKLTELNGKLDGVKSLVEKVPAAGKSAIAKLVGDHLGKIKELLNQVLAIPGVGDKVKPITDAIMTKLSALTA